MLLAPFLSMPLSLVPLQILWINLETDGLPGLALAIEQGEPDVMRRPPFRPNESIFSRGLGWQILWVGALMGAVSLGIGWYSWGLAGRPAVSGNGFAVHWQTMLFTTLVLAQMGNALALRSNRKSIFTIGFFSNFSMLGAIALTFVLQLGLIYVPFLQGIFSTAALTWWELLISLAASTIVFFAVELEKWRRRQQRA